MAQLNTTNFGGRKNYIINGAMDIWQFDTSYSALTTDTYICDMWQYKQSNDGSMNASRSTTVPTVAQGALFQPNYSINLSPNAADTSIGAGQHSQILTKIEGYNYRRLKDKTVTLSFFVRSSKTGTYCISFRNNAQDRSYISEYTISQANTWEKKTISLTFNQTGGTENYANGFGINISFTLAGGTTYQSTPNTWLTGNYYSTSNQVNFMDSVSNQFYLALVQLEIGNMATSFEYKSIASELEECERFFEKSYNMDIAPGTVTAAGSVIEGATRNSGAITFGASFKTTKRMNPTVTIYSDNSGASGVAYCGSSGDISATAARIGSRGFGQVTVTAPTNVNVSYHWTADARFV